MREKPMSMDMLRQALVEHIRVQNQMIKIAVIQWQATSLLLGNLELLYLREAQRWRRR